MSNRRPHWSDDLTGAVTELVGEATVCWKPLPSGVFQSEEAADIALRIIAVVEDWVYDNFQGGEYDNPVEFTPEELAIQRVRGICEVIVENAHQFYEVWDEDPTAAQVPYGQWMVARHILRALEGDSDD